MLCRRRAESVGAAINRLRAPMTQPNDLSRSRIPFCQESTLIVVVDMSQSSWLVAGIVPGIERHPLKKLDPDEEALLQLIQRWRDEGVKVGRPITSPSRSRPGVEGGYRNSRAEAGWPLMAKWMQQLLTVAGAWLARPWAVGVVFIFEHPLDR